MPRSAREIDVDPRTFVGLSFPLRADSNNNFAMTKSSLEQSVHNLRNLLLTSLRERPSNPDFGSRLKELVFEPIDEALPEKIEGEVRKAVGIWLPYINVEQVDTLVKNGDKGEVVVRISFTTTLDPDVTNSIDIEP
jgi:phage baseplate assembly protein W